MKKIVIVLFVIVFLMPIFGVEKTSSEKSWLNHKNMAEESVLKNLKWTVLGPYFQGGRITDIEAYENNPYKFLVATASGGVWITNNNATTWKPIFDNESSITIGDIAISQTDESLIWVGTGEQNSSRSSYAGTGVFKSTDGGKNWENVGLRDSHHIGRIVIDPSDNNIVYVAVIGHLFTDNEERGVFKTTDGGKNWKKVLEINSKTGVIDLVMDPKNSKILYAAAWERERKAWNFTESGEGSGIYKTIDGGKNWKRIMNGIPGNKYTGRIGLAISRSNPKIVYALVDNQEARKEPVTKSGKKTSGISVNSLMTMESSDFLKLKNSKIELFLKENKAPEYITVEMVKGMVISGKLNPKKIAMMLSDANARLLNSNVKGAEVYKSTDRGGSWFKTHAKPLSKWMYSTYGYYFGQIRVSPKDENTIYILGVPLLKSTDSGKSFKDISKQGGIYGENGVHADMQAMWIDPKLPRRVLLGNDGGLNISYDEGDTWIKVNNIPIAQCYTINYDFDEPYNIYSGLQDNGVVKGPGNFRYGDRANIWNYIIGGDGAFVEPEPGNPETVYCEYQFGNLFRVDMKSGKEKKIQPESKDRKNRYRFNWLTPFKISKHNPYTIILGANKVLKSVDRGENWIEISPDLTRQQHIDGDVPYATIVSIDESAITPEILYAGTDDGNVWVTKDSGGKWEQINKGLPDKWVSRIVASKFKRERVYVTLTGYRDDDFNAYLFKSDNFGKEWEMIKNNLPDESVNVIREDLKNENILYLGTDKTVYISYNMGQFWYSMRGNLPTVAVYDIKIHPRDNDLIIGTHGRGVFKIKLDHIQKINPSAMNNPLYLLEKETVIVPMNTNSYKKKIIIPVFIKNSGNIRMIIKNNNYKTVAWKDFSIIDKGITNLEWDMKFKNKQLKNGEYNFTLIKDKYRVKGKIKI